MDPPDQIQPQLPAQVDVNNALPSFAPEYAGFGRRFVAVLIDGVIMGLISFIIIMPLGFINLFIGGGNSGNEFLWIVLVQILGQIVSLSASIIYPIYFIGKKGATPGKMIMRIKVIRKDEAGEIGYIGAFLRETVGKFLSFIVFGLGFLTMIRDPHKQTWHDKIANTIVIKVG